MKRSLKKFYEEVGLKYPEEEIIYETLRGILRQRFVNRFLESINGSLLDVGCNRGMYLEYYQNGMRYGVELSLNVLLKAHNSKPKHLIVADAENLYCFRAQSFDNVLCSEVLEHCLDPIAVVQGIAHVLKPGGRALITTPNYKKQPTKWIGLGSLPYYGVSCECDDRYYHTAFRPDELKSLALKVGLKIIRVGTLERDIKYAAKLPAVILLMGRFINRFIGSNRLFIANQIFFNKLTILIYRICHTTGLDRLLLTLFPEGVRSFVLVKK
ncbi:MAG: methyltransferase domain-containing protein [bacterium]|nr:methyltransferase domain-containing protein [bacterium]